MNMNSLQYWLEGIITKKKKLPYDSGGATRIGSSVRGGREIGEASA
jgi:hypothetical protein